MKKNYLQDVIPPNQKRSIRDIPLPNSKEAKEKAKPTEEVSEKAPEPVIKKPSMGDVKIKKVSSQDPEQTSYQEPPRETPPSDFDFSEKPQKRKNKKTVYAVLIVLIIFAGWFLNRSKAEVIVYSKSESTFAQNEFNIADKNLDMNEGVLGYKTLKIEKEVQTTVDPTGEEEVSQKASGMIRIINEYSAEDQKLVERTRFEANNGKIYRIAESITVPGYEKSGEKIIAGEIEVEVFADEAGEDFNIGLTKFTIPGFEGLPQYETMTAESVSEMTGGFVGVKKIVSDDSKASSLESLKKEAKDQIITEINNSSDEFTIIFNEENINYSRLTENDLKNGVELKITASVEAYVFDSKELARKITDENIINAPEGDVVIVNKESLDLNVLEVEMEGEEENYFIEKLSVEGNVEISWIIDAEEIQKELSGKKRSQFSEVISSQNGISKAEVSLKPFWKNTFPKESKIEILIQK